MSEVRLIDANALMDTVRQHDYPLAQKHGSIDNGMFTIGIQQVVDEQPTITPESLGYRKEVVGRWEQSNEFDEDANVYSCSACGEPWVLIDGTPKENNMSYCPNCGANMDGEP